MEVDKEEIIEQGRPLKQDGTCPSGYPVKKGNRCFRKSDNIKDQTELSCKSMNKKMRLLLHKFYIDENCED